jgi:hypothetical protein
LSQGTVNLNIPVTLTKYFNLYLGLRYFWDTLYERKIDEAVAVLNII